MADLQAAVLPKPLSRVVRPVWPSNLPISKPALPTVASTTGYSNSWPWYRSTTELSLTSSLTDVPNLRGIAPTHLLPSPIRATSVHPGVVQKGQLLQRSRRRAVAPIQEERHRNPTVLTGHRRRPIVDDRAQCA